MRRLLSLFVATLLAFGPAAHADLRANSPPAGVAYAISESGLPFIALSSGSVSAAGAISGITALPRAYASAYCLLPASILATSGTGSTAGFYFCTFTTTTAGTVFLNPYSSGTPSIPSPTIAVTNGQGGFTGVTGETAAQSITLPAGAMGANGSLRVTRNEAVTNSAGTKTATTKLGTTALRSFVLTTSVTYPDLFTVINRGVQSVQDVSVSLTGGNFSATAGAEQAIAVDLSQASSVNLFVNKNTATDNQIIRSYIVEVMFSP